MADLAKEVDLPPSRRLADVLADWEQDKLRSGACQPYSARHQVSRISVLLQPLLSEDISALTPRRAAAMYERHTGQAVRRTGRPRSAATHRFELRMAKLFFGWAVKRGYIGADPFRDVMPIGKPHAGKPQLRIEEARLFTKAALRHFEEWNQPLALGALLALMMVLRTSEVMNRVVRDLDDHAHYLWIDEGKTRNARRHLEVPSMLSPCLLRLAQGKHPEELLFGVSAETGRPPLRQEMYRTVQRICIKAGVPRVCTHSLRGLWATLAVKSGAAAHAVAESLGHHSFAVTQRHYAEAAAVTNSASARVLDTLARRHDLAPLSTGELLECLDEETLAKLTELLSARALKGKPGN